MKTLETIKNIAVLDTYYSGNYITELQTDDAKYFKQVIKNYTIFETEDNIKFAIEFDYDKISQTIHFDDETDAPEIDEDFFVKHTTRNNQNTKLYTSDFLYLAKYKDGIYIVRSAYLQEHGGNYEQIRRLFVDEIEYIRSIAKEKDELFAKRVRTYYRRYKDLISCKGYWANR